MKISTGATVSFSSGFFGEMLNISWGSMERGAIETTHMGTAAGFKQFIPGNLFDPGELEIEFNFQAEKTPPFTGAAETITVTYNSDGAGATSTWSALGFLTKFESEAPVEEVMKGKATVKFTGPITIVA